MNWLGWGLTGKIGEYEIPELNQAHKTENADTAKWSVESQSISLDAEGIQCAQREHQGYR